MADRSNGTSRRLPRNWCSGSERLRVFVRTQRDAGLRDTEPQRRLGSAAEPIGVYSALADLRVSASLWLSLLCVLGPLCVGHASAARNGTIRGRVELRRPTAPTERRPGVAELGSPAPRDLPNLLRSVVYLESAPRGAFEVEEGGHAI